MGQAFRPARDFDTRAGKVGANPVVPDAGRGTEVQAAQDDGVHAGQ